MRIFDIPKHVEEILSAIEEGREPEPEMVKALVEEGPATIDHFCRAISNHEAGWDHLDKRIKELRRARDIHAASIGSMRRKLQEVIETSFNGKVETHEYTCWIQDGVLKIRPVGRKKEVQ